MRFNPILSALPALAIAARCPPTGPVLPKPDLPESFEPAGLLAGITTLLNSTFPTWNVSTTSFSLELTTLNSTFFSYHHTAGEKSKKGVQEVDSDSVYRIASITKVFNVLALLLNAPRDLDTPITEYVSELEGSEVFSEITLRMLAGQVSGLRREGSAFDLYSERGDQLLELGFPAPDPEDVPDCDVVPGRTCTRSEFLDNLLSDKSKLSWLPGDRAAYSNPAYTLLGYAMESMTGKAFAEILQDDILDPLNLTSTSLDPPDPSKAVISVGAGEIFWGLSIGTYNGTAGLFSTPSDLTSFARSILRSDLLSPVQTRLWLKPTLYAGGLTTDVGMPWEIMRVPNLTPDGRPIYVYTKSGGIPGYSSMMLLLPEYDVGGTILVSSDASDQPAVALTTILLESLIPSLESLSRKQAESAYAGRYVGSAHNSTNGEAKLSFTVDDGPGLKITEWINNGDSILDFLASTENTTPEGIDVRLYPVGDANRWRMAVEPVVSDTDGASLADQRCLEWFQVGQMRYASLPLDEFDFDVEDGVVVGVENLGLRQSLVKDA